ncbi:MAG: tRNA 2-thiouridine(34) synthase MnmA [Gammaproteobacteria bacterium]|nr:tRNA 2-thiouridine(34) synthase MnmA [Gammaproteobacteria bacterium]
MSGAYSRRVIVALSGGVDSAVAALCLLREGYHVEALHMTNWDDANEYCTAGADLADARRVAADLGIRLHHANFSREYRDEVFAGFLGELRAGRTPNPDVACNRHIKFGVFIEYARRLGADLIATGHYARVLEGPRPRLFRPADREKDQTYFLHAVDGSALTQTLFPLGLLEKAEVRRLARDYGLSNHARRDSTGICFVGERPFREFLAEHLGPEPGPILGAAGQELGEHIGLPFYTLGQRAGLQIGGRNDSLESPWFVAAKDLARNALIVVQGRDHPWLFRRELKAAALRWLTGEPAGLAAGREFHARIRHRHVPARCNVVLLPDGCAQVRFETPQRVPAPGQYVVFYQGDECLGGGTILEDRPASAMTNPAALTTA